MPSTIHFCCLVERRSWYLFIAQQVTVSEQNETCLAFSIGDSYFSLLQYFPSSNGLDHLGQLGDYKEQAQKTYPDDLKGGA